MTNFPGHRLLVAAIVAFAVLVGLAYSPSANAATQRGSVYLMRGFANVFSLGMDALNDKLKARGVNSHVLGDADWLTISREIEARYAKDKSALPVIVMGHSLGANATELIAAELATRKIPVALIINFDATSPPLVPANVTRVINFYAPDGFGKILKPGPGFRGRIENVNVQKLLPGIDHLNIEKTDKLHRIAIAAVLRTLGR
jgi:hypothetical protein